MKNNEKLTSANIRYLLTIRAFSDANKPIRNTYLAEHFHYKKSSIHAMLKHLSAIGMITKDEDNMIYLTEKGEEISLRYQAYFIAIDTMMQKCFPDFDERENAVLALLAEIPEQSLQRIIQQQ